MMPELGDTQKNSILRALDPDLPILASEAAIDFDNILSNGSGELRAIRQLAQKLKNSIQSDIASGQSRSSMDTATLVVLNEAVIQSARGSASQSVDDLLKEAFKIADELSTDYPKCDRNLLEQARDFCLALSRAAMTYHKSIRDLSLPHPFRR